MASARGRCGLCYGPSWAFVIWKLLNDLFLVPERLGLAAVLVRGGRVVQNVDVRPVVLVAWVFWRAETLANALR